ncbi:hypothetical protein [Metabacillus fastidiosus]|uniref:hypothetical protein n=1 Tax=Metabacillus fastidiosus TaxID=1458 RepID=UPI003D271CB0
MEIVYDIKLNNDELIEGCYFIEQQRKVKNGLGQTMIILPEALKCFIGESEVLNKDFTNAEVLKIYDSNSGNDITEMITDKIETVSIKLGYNVPFPIPRERVILE